MVSMLLLFRMSSSMCGVCLSRVLGITDSLLLERSSRVSLELMRRQDENVKMFSSEHFLTLWMFVWTCPGAWRGHWRPGRGWPGWGRGCGGWGCRPCPAHYDPDWERRAWDRDTDVRWLRLRHSLLTTTTILFGNTLKYFNEGWL